MAWRTNSPSLSAVPPVEYPFPQEVRGIVPKHGSTWEASERLESCLLPFHHPQPHLHRWESGERQVWVAERRWGERHGGGGSRNVLCCFQMQRSNLSSLGAVLRAFWSVPASHVLTQKLLPNITGWCSGKVVGA